VVTVNFFFALGLLENAKLLEAATGLLSLVEFALPLAHFPVLVQHLQEVLGEEARGVWGLLPILVSGVHEVVLKIGNSVRRLRRPASRAACHRRGPACSRALVAPRARSLRLRLELEIAGRVNCVLNFA